MIEVLWYFLIMATAFPVGLFLASLCSDEIKKDRKYFLGLSYFLLAVSFIFLILSYSISLILSPIYLVFVLAVLILKGRNKSRK